MNIEILNKGEDLKVVETDSLNTAPPLLSLCHFCSECSSIRGKYPRILNLNA